MFTDGACSGNPGPGGWAAIVVTPDGHVRELGGGEARTTNNRMEMTAPLEALRAVASRKEPVTVYSDSTYVISGITSWVHGWKRRGWTRADGGEVLNRDIWEALDRTVASRRGIGPVEWRYVKGHAGNPGNERCDEISVAYSQGGRWDLYDGPLSGYDVDVTQVSWEGADVAKAKSTASKPKSSGKPVYLSLLDGVLQRHATWKECETRVKGRPNARYRKATSPTEEKQILASWGLATDS